MSEKRQVWATLAELLSRLQKEVPVEQGNGIEQELRKLGKTQFKANTLAEEQSARWERLLAAWETQQAERDGAIEQLVAERVGAAEREWLLSLLPALDGMDHALRSAKQSLTPLLTGPDGAALVGWLQGILLVRERLLGVLAAHGVTPIPAVGRPFDPHQHVAVATTVTGNYPSGTVVAEERRGYRTEQAVLRYAEVVVHRPAPVPQPTVSNPTMQKEIA